MLVVLSPPKEEQPGITSTDTSKICPVANNSWNSPLLQEAISFVCNFQTQHKLFVGAILCFITVKTLSSLSHTVHVYPFWSGAPKSVISTQILQMGQDRDSFCQYFTFSNRVTISLALHVLYRIAQIRAQTRVNLDLLERSSMTAFMACWWCITPRSLLNFI